MRISVRDEIVFGLLALWVSYKVAGRMVKKEGSRVLWTLILAPVLIITTVGALYAGCSCMNHFDR